MNNSASSLIETIQLQIKTIEMLKQKNMSLTEQMEVQNRKLENSLKLLQGNNRTIESLQKGILNYKKQLQISEEEKDEMEETMRDTMEEIEYLKFSVDQERNIAEREKNANKQLNIKEKLRLRYNSLKGKSSSIKERIMIYFYLSNKPEVTNKELLSHGFINPKSGVYGVLRLNESKKNNYTITIENESF